MTGRAEHRWNKQGSEQWSRMRPWFVGTGIIVMLLSLPSLVRMFERMEGRNFLAVPVMSLVAIFWGWAGGMATWALADIALFGARDAGPAVRAACGFGAVAITFGALWRLALMFGLAG